MNLLFIEPPVNYPNIDVNLGCNLGIALIVAHVKKKCDVNILFHSFEYAKLSKELSSRSL